MATEIFLSAPRAWQFSSLFCDVKSDESSEDSFDEKLCVGNKLWGSTKYANFQFIITKIEEAYFLCKCK